MVLLKGNIMKILKGQGKSDNFTHQSNYVSKISTNGDGYWFLSFKLELDNRVNISIGSFPTDVDTVKMPLQGVLCCFFFF